VKESTRFNSLNISLLLCRLMSVCTVRGRLPPSHHVLHVLAVQHSNQHSNHEGRSVTQIHKINTQKLLSQLKHCMNLYPNINQCKCNTKEKLVALTIVTCACLLGNKVNIKRIPSFPLKGTG